MPFAPTILAERQGDYLQNSKHLRSEHMLLAFRTTDAGKEALAAAIHPYDGTCRPQILTQDANEGYYRLIKRFEELTGVGAVLNTSFNMHGDPIVRSPEDAIDTLDRSGLEFLALEDWILTKHDALPE